MRYTQKLRVKMKASKARMHKKAFEGVDLHAHLLPHEIDYDGLCETLLCSAPTVRYFVKAGILPIARRVKNKMAFDKETAIKALTPFMVDGRLTLAKPKNQN